MAPPASINPPADHHPGALLASVSVVGGLRVSLRLAHPSEAPRVRAFLDRLSPETRRRRFGAPQPKVTGALVRHFTFPDPADA